MQRATYVRLYTDAGGETHFEDLDLELVPVDFAPPAAPLNVAQFLPVSRSYWVGGPVGWAGEAPHPTPRRQVFCVLGGECRVTTSDGDTRTFRTGSVLLLEDTWGKGHSTTVLGAENLLIFGVALADEV